jgi:hypothetical protein
MIFDGLGADLQDFTDFFDVLAFGDEPKNFALPARQPSEGAFLVDKPFQRNLFGGCNKHFQVLPALQTAFQICLRKIRCSKSKTQIGFP